MRSQTSPHPHRRWWRCLDKDRTRPPSSRPTKTHTPSKLEKELLNSSDTSCDRNSERQPCSVSARDLSKSSRVSLSWVCCFYFSSTPREPPPSRAIRQPLAVRSRPRSDRRRHFQVCKTDEWGVFVAVVVFLWWRMKKQMIFFRNLEKLCHAPRVKHFVNRISRNGDWTQRAAVCEFGAASKAELGKASYQRESIEPMRSVKNVVQAIKWLMAIDIFITSGV